MKTLLFSIALSILFTNTIKAQPHPSVTLTWVGSVIGTPPTGGDPPTGYHIQRSLTHGGPYTIINQVSASVLTYVDTTITVGLTYYYVVTAFNSSGVESGPSNEAVCTSPFQAPGAPSNLSGTVK